MTRKSRFLLIVGVASLPLFAACSDTVTGPAELQTRKDGTSELAAMGCGDLMPWGKAPCVPF
jgi:hypothetical protein